MRRKFITAYNSLEELLTRLNELISLINGALLLSHGIRKNSEVNIILVKEWSELRIIGRFLRNYRPDFESASGLIKRALARGESKGIIFKRIQHKKVHVTHDIVFVIDPKGVKVNYLFNILKERKSKGIAIVLPSAKEYVSFSEKCRVYHINMSENLYTTDQVVTILNIVLDNMGW